MQLWVADNRKRLGLTPLDIARLTGVTVDTARGWESRGAPNQDAIDVLVRRFGVPAPAGSGASDGPDLAGLLARLEDQAKAIDRLAAAIELLVTRPAPVIELAAARAAVAALEREAEDTSPLPSPDPPADAEGHRTVPPNIQPIAPRRSGSTRP